MTAPEVVQESAPAEEAAVPHLYCKVCYGVRAFERAAFPVTSMCGWVTRTPVGVRPAGQILPMCPVCLDYENANRCPRGHRLRTWMP